MKDNIYGPKFRAIRKEQNLTLIKAAKGVTSKSTLSLWEKGNDNLSFSKVLKLLNLNHIQPLEFITSPISSQLLELAQKIDAAYTKSDIVSLHKYTIEKLNLSRSHPQNSIFFLEFCITCNFYQDLSQEIIFTKNDQKRLSNILSKISEWDYEGVFYFGNTLGLLAPKSIYRLAVSLINYAINTNLVKKRWYEEVLNCILNASFILIKTDYHLAQKLLKIFNQLPLSDRYAYEKIQKNFLSTIINYIRTKNDKDVKRMIEAIDLLKLNNMVDGFKTMLSQINQIYFH